MGKCVDDSGLNDCDCRERMFRRLEDRCGKTFADVLRKRLDDNPPCGGCDAWRMEHVNLEAGVRRLSHRSAARTRGRRGR